MAQDAFSRTRGLSLNATGSASYRLDKQTQLNADFYYFGHDSDAALSSRYRSSAPTGPLAQDYDSTGPSQTSGDGFGVSTTYVRQLGGDDHDVTLRLGYANYLSSSDTLTLQAYQLPIQPDLFQDLAARFSQSELDWKAEYKGPLAKGKLDAGFEGHADRDQNGNQGSLGTSGADAAPDPALTNRFDFDLNVDALFATYQRSFGKLDVMPGLRLEEVEFSFHQAASPLITRSSYFEAYPTLHLGYQLDANAQLTASYSRRVSRPGAQQYDPVRIYDNPLFFTQGNPNLKPTITNSYEAAYEYTKGETYFTATSYYRDTGNMVSDILQSLGGAALLSTVANIGHSRTAGEELVANAPITKTLSVNVSGNLLWDDIVAPNNGVETAQSGAEMYGRVKLNWNPTKSDFVQLSAFAQGRQLTAQGSISSWGYLDIGYRHKFNDRLAGEITVIDPLDSVRFREGLETADLDQHTVENLNLRAVSIGVTYTFGASHKPPAKDFEFDTGGR